MESVKLRKTARFLSGHQWVFSNELAQSPRGFAPGQLVEIHDMKDNFLGIGYINPMSLIAVRVLTRANEPVDAGFFKKRMEAAISYRQRFLEKFSGKKAGESSLRLVFSEADYLPGLIVDKYADVVVIQLLTSGMEAVKSDILEAVDSLLSPRAIVLKNNSRIRALEGLSLYKEIAKGDITPLPVIEEDGVLFEIDPLGGQKTGFFLDQRENRLLLKALASTGAMPGKNHPGSVGHHGLGLDLFCYAGGWGMHLAHAGAEKVIMVDESESALARAGRNAELNGLSGRIEPVRADVFAFLKNEFSTAGDETRYDFIVLDPPAFVKSAKKLKEAIKAYTLLNGQCMRLLKPGGILATSSCSYHLGREAFVEMLRMAARTAGRNVKIIEQRFQGRDHPVLLSMPETQYLKCAFLTAD